MVYSSHEEFTKGAFIPGYCKHWRKLILLIKDRSPKSLSNGDVVSLGEDLCTSQHRERQKKGSAEGIDE